MTLTDLPTSLLSHVLSFLDWPLDQYSITEKVLRVTSKSMATAIDDMCRVEPEMKCSLWYRRQRTTKRCSVCGKRQCAPKLLKYMCSVCMYQGFQCNNKYLYCSAGCAPPNNSLVDPCPSSADPIQRVVCICFYCKMKRFVLQMIYHVCNNCGERYNCCTNSWNGSLFSSCAPRNGSEFSCPSCKVVQQVLLQNTQ